MLSFWGKNMQAVIAELRRRGVYRAGVSVVEFRELADRESGVSPPRNSSPEDAAAQWLRGLAKKPPA